MIVNVTIDCEGRENDDVLLSSVLQVEYGPRESRGDPSAMAQAVLKGATPGMMGMGVAGVRSPLFMAGITKELIGRYGTRPR
jgi:hypothetical protein